MIRKRFSDPIIERLLASEWWRYNPKDYAPLKMADPASFLDRFEAMKPSLEPLALGALTGQEILQAASS